MKLTVKSGKHIFSEEISNLADLEAIREYVKAFCLIYKVEECDWKLEGEGVLEEQHTGLGALFG